MSSRAAAEEWTKWHHAYEVAKHGAVLPRTLPVRATEHQPHTRWPSATVEKDTHVVVRKGAYIQDLLMSPTADWASTFSNVIKDIDGEGFAGAIMNRNSFAMSHPWLEQHVRSCMESYDTDDHTYAFFRRKLSTLNNRPFDVEARMPGQREHRTIACAVDAVTNVRGKRYQVTEVRFADPWILFDNAPPNALLAPFGLSLGGKMYHAPGDVTRHESFEVSDPEVNMMALNALEGHGPIADVLASSNIQGACIAIWGFSLPKKPDDAPSALAKLAAHLASVAEPSKRKAEWKRVMPPTKHPFFPGKPREQLGYLYLIREREFYEDNRPIYKAGMTIQAPDNVIQRLRAYKKGSEISMTIQCDAAHVKRLEQEMLAVMRAKFNTHGDGHEYFEGDVNEMQSVIWDVVSEAQPPC
jgi:hypothetical protein